MRYPTFFTIRPSRPALWIVLLIGVVASGASTLARDERQAQPIEHDDAAGQAAAPTPPPAAQAPAPGAQLPPPPATPARAHPINVKIEVTITDQAGTNAPLTKTLNVIVADRENGAIRSQVTVPFRVGNVSMPNPWSTMDLPLNIDTKPELVDANRVKVRLVLNYRTGTPPKSPEDGEPWRRSDVTETIVMVLESGKPMVISQSADAATDRKVTVELKATIMR